MRALCFFLLTGLALSFSFSASSRARPAQRLDSSLGQSQKQQQFVESADLGIIIVDHGSRVPEANAMLLTLVDKYKTRFKHAIVEGAHMEMASPSIADAFRACVDQGAKRIVCHPYFLSRGRHVKEDVPKLLEEASSEHGGAVPYVITEPLGMQDRILDLIDSSIFPDKHGL